MGDVVRQPGRLTAAPDNAVAVAGSGRDTGSMADELTIAEAAELLSVSEPYLLDRIEAGDVQFLGTGEDRRLPLRDVLAYREQMAERAEAALVALTAEAEALGLYDE